MRLISIAFAVAMTTTAFAATAVAADQVSEEPESVRQACAADFTKFCPGQTARSEEGRACMRQHRTEFSQGCQTAMEARRRERMDRIKTACSADLAKFCSGAASQVDERPGRCLRDHRDQLSESCKSALPDRHG